MSRMERVYAINQLLTTRRAVSLQDLKDELEVSRATLKRDLEYMRDRLNAPIVWDRSLRGYRCEGSFTLPGLHLSSSELQALLVVQQFLSRMEPGVIGRQLTALRTLLSRTLGSSDHSADEVARRIRILQIASRPVRAAHFQAVSTAILSRKRLDLLYYSRSRDRVSRRQVSPQRLIYYRDNWYMDAWCHAVSGLRSFALDAMREVSIADVAAIDVPGEQLDTELGKGYGIFSGVETQTAVLRFSPHMARWVAQEKWHSQQSSRYDEVGYYILELPYTNDRELIMDVLRYGSDVEVLAPAVLRDKVAASLEQALAPYRAK